MRQMLEKVEVCSVEEKIVKIFLNTLDTSSDYKTLIFSSFHKAVVFVIQICNCFQKVQFF